MRLLLIYGALLVLLALTVAAGFAGLGAWSIVVSLGIAVLKALLIALFFMRLGNAGVLLRLTALSGVLWLSILLLLSFADYAQREKIVMEHPWETLISAEPKLTGITIAG